MRRRALLAAAGTAAALFGAGCQTLPTGDGPAESAPDPTPAPVPDDRTTESSTTTSSSDDALAWRPTGDPVRDIVVGDPDAVVFPASNRPHVVAVGNDGSERRITIAVTAGDAATPTVETTVSVPSGGFVRLSLVEPVAHTVRIGLSSGADTRIDLPATLIDCAASRTHALVGPGGRVTHATVSEMVGCPSPEVTEAAVTGAGECAASADPDTATVRFVEETIRIEGTLTTATPCRRPTIATTLSDGVLRVTIGATPIDATCVQCLGAVSYRALIRMAHGYPGRVVVVHDGRGDAETVTSIAPADRRHATNVSHPD